MLVTVIDHLIKYATLCFIVFGTCISSRWMGSVFVFTWNEKDDGDLWLILGTLWSMFAN